MLLLLYAGNLGAIQVMRTAEHIITPAPTAVRHVRQPPACCAMRHACLNACILTMGVSEEARHCGMGRTVLRACARHLKDCWGHLVAGRARSTAGRTPAAHYCLKRLSLSSGRNDLDGLWVSHLRRQSPRRTLALSLHSILTKLGRLAQSGTRTGTKVDHADHRFGWRRLTVAGYNSCEEPVGV